MLSLPPHTGTSTPALTWLVVSGVLPYTPLSYILSLTANLKNTLESYWSDSSRGLMKICADCQRDITKEIQVNQHGYTYCERCFWRLTQNV